MSGRTKQFIAFGLVAVASVAVGVRIGSVAGGGVTDTSIMTSAGGTIIIDASSEETFTPDTSTAPVVGLLSPDAAYQMFTGRSDLQLPPGATVQRGYLSMPLVGSPGEYVFDHVLVYAYTWTNCAPGNRPVDPDGDGQPPPTHTPLCRQWVFLDARTGEHLDMTWTK